MLIFSALFACERLKSSDIIGHMKSFRLRYLRGEMESTVPSI